MEIIDVETLLHTHGLPVVDVRSPGEFNRGHIPNAQNVPLFDDAERAEIGTIYKQVGRHPAVNRGLEIATAKAERLIHSVKAIAADDAFAVHCWRGGMRSEGFAWLCEDCGLKPRVLGGGYKSFRRAAHHSFTHPRRVILLAGHTGAGKTKLLAALKEQGQQVIDLEGLANHRGSAFGGIGQKPQPTTEQFENKLFLQWHALDAARPVWFEGESRSIGKAQIPQAIWDQMTDAPTIFIEVDREQRVDFLVQEYGDYPADELSAAIQKISKRLGGERLQTALAALQRGDVRTFAASVLHYYDKSYSRSLLQRPADSVHKFPLRRPADPDATADLIQLAADLTSCDLTNAKATPPANVETGDHESPADFMFRI